MECHSHSLPQNSAVDYTLIYLGGGKVMNLQEMYSELLDGLFMGEGLGRRCGYNWNVMQAAEGYRYWQCLCVVIFHISHMINRHFNSYATITLI